MIAYYANKIITENGIIEKAYLLVNQGKIMAIKKEIQDGIEVINYDKHLISPGFIDIHTHGALGYEPGYGTKEELEKWCNFQLEHGVTSFLATTASIPLKNLKKAVEDICEINKDKETNILGLHLEGPFFGQSKKIGTQNPAYVKDDFSKEFKDFIANNQEYISYLSLNPDIAVAKEIVSFCVKHGIKVGAGHSEISYQDFLKKKKDGYTSIVHTFNGMEGLHHRKPGLALAACMDEDLYAEIICDGFHIIYPMLELFFKLKGYEKAILITDSMLATGMPPGSSYSIGGLNVKVDEKGRVFNDTGSLAGSTLTMDKAVRNIVNNLSLPLEKVINIASLNPAKLLGINENKGSIAINKDADFIVLNEKIDVVTTYLRGKQVYAK